MISMMQVAALIGGVLQVDCPWYEFTNKGGWRARERLLVFVFGIAASRKRTTGCVPMVGRQRGHPLDKSVSPTNVRLFLSHPVKRTWVAIGDKRTSGARNCNSRSGMPSLL